MIVDTHNKYMDDLDTHVNLTSMEQVNSRFSSMVDRPGGMNTSMNDPTRWDEKPDEISMKNVIEIQFLKHKNPDILSPRPVFPMCMRRGRIAPREVNRPV